MAKADFTFKANCKPVTVQFLQPFSKIPLVKDIQKVRMQNCVPINANLNKTHGERTCFFRIKRIKG